MQISCSRHPTISTFCYIFQYFSNWKYFIKATINTIHFCKWGMPLTWYTCQYASDLICMSICLLINIQVNLKRRSQFLSIFVYLFLFCNATFLIYPLPFNSISESLNQHFPPRIQYLINIQKTYIFTEHKTIITFLVPFNYIYITTIPNNNNITDQF